MIVFFHVHLWKLLGCTEVVGGLVWRTQDSFIHMSGALMGMAGKLSSAEIVN